jgi:hypothetical protein
MVPRALEKEYPVWLVRRDQNALDDLHVYRGEQLPEPNQIITVTTKFNPGLFSPSPLFRLVPLALQA